MCSCGHSRAFNIRLCSVQLSRPRQCTSNFVKIQANRRNITMEWWSYLLRSMYRVMCLIKLLWWAVAWPFLLPCWIYRKWRKTVRTAELFTGHRTVHLGWHGFYTRRRPRRSRRQPPRPASIRARPSTSRGTSVVIRHEADRIDVNTLPAPPVEGPKDPLERARHIIDQAGYATPSLLQQEMGIGYDFAARLIADLEKSRPPNAPRSGGFDQGPPNHL